MKYLCRHKKEDRSRKYLTKTCNIKLQKSHYGLHDYVTSSGTGVGKPLLVYIPFYANLLVIYWIVIYMYCVML